jgi:hypothetical protein
VRYRQGYTVRIANRVGSAAAEKCSYGGYSHAVRAVYGRPVNVGYVKSLCFAKIFPASVTGTWASASANACPECRRIVEHHRL